MEKNIVVLRDRDDIEHDIDLVIIGNITTDNVKKVISDMHKEMEEYDERDEVWDFSMVEWIEDHLPKEKKFECYTNPENVWY